MLSHHDAGRADMTVCSLTAEDCHSSGKISPSKDSTNYPSSADLQLSAKSAEGRSRRIPVGSGRASSRAAPASHHGYYWSCPIRRLVGIHGGCCWHKPNLYFGFSRRTFRHDDGAGGRSPPNLTKFVAPTVDRKLAELVSAETEVFIDEQTGDVWLRCRGHRRT